MHPFIQMISAYGSWQFNEEVASHGSTNGFGITGKQKRKRNMPNKKTVADNALEQFSEPVNVPVEPPKKKRLRNKVTVGGKTYHAPVINGEVVPYGNVREKLQQNIVDRFAELNLDPIERLERLAEDPDTPPDVRARIYLDLMGYYRPKRKPVDEMGKADVPTQMVIKFDLGIDAGDAKTIDGDVVPKIENGKGDE